MKKQIKITAFLMTILMLLPLLPIQILLANYQNPVTQLTITSLSSTSLDKTGEYDLNFKFGRPVASSKEDLSAVNQDMNERAKNFELQWRNVSAFSGTDYTATNQKSIENNTPDEVIDYNMSPSLDFGSIYMYRVIPWHEHNYPNPNYPHNSTSQYISKRAPLDTPNNTAESLFLSDIQVTSIGNDETITVEWDDPTFLGNDLFTSYKIYYQQGGADVQMSDSTAFVQVGIDNPALIRNREQHKLSYTFTNPGLDIGKLYALKVVPEYNGKTIDQGNLKVKYDDVEYPITASGREYRTNDLYIKPSLSITREGRDYLRLSWSSYLNSLLDIDSVEIYKSSYKNFSNAELIATISTPTATTVNYILVDRPLEITYYKVVIKYVDKSNPSIPIIKSIETDVKEYNPAYEAFDPTKPTILEVNDADKKPYSMEITWEAFVRQAYTQAEKANVINSHGDIIDKGILYDIYVTDDLTNFDIINTAFLSQKIVDNLPASSLTDVIYDYAVNDDIIKKPAYKYTVQNYITKQGTEYVKKSIEDNKIYYIMIIAKRDPSGEKSQRAYYSHYYEPKTEITGRPIMISKPPLRIKKDSDGIEVVTKESLTIQWDTNWYEIYNEADGNWYSKVGVTTSGAVVFGKAITQELINLGRVIEFGGSIYNTQPDPTLGYPQIYAKLASLGVAEPEKKIPLRHMDLGDAQYEINVAEYDYVEENGGYDVYLESLTEADWQGINPSGTGMLLEFDVTNTTNPTASALIPNTAYTVLLRPFIVDDDNKKQAYYPNYIVATTLSDRQLVEITPTVPKIEAVSSTDTSVKIRFEYLEGLQYELFWSELSPNYPDKGIMISDSDLLAKGELKQADGKAYLYFDIESLFPLTTYYVWIRSYSENTGQRVESAYSNPISLTTKDMAPPDTPSGLGLVSKDHIEIYNKENELSYLPIDYEYMIIEWFKDINDTANTFGKTGTGDGNSATEILSSENILDNYIVKFNKLIGNRGYYVRAKTRLTITKSGDNIEKYYQYIVQLSTDIDFADYVEVMVPSSIGTINEKYTLVKESAWTDTIRLTTSPYTGEYDGDKNANLYPLPPQNFEMIYDRYEDRLTYRYRSNETDQLGNKDNMVDQRFISDLIKNKVYNVVVDVTAHNGKIVKNGNVEIPYSIVKSLEKHKISLTIKADTSTFTFSPGFIETNEIKALNDLKPMSKIKIAIDSITKDIPSVTPYASYVSKPKKMSISLVTDSKTTNMSMLANAYKVDLKLINRYTVLDKNTDAYVYSGNETDWVRAKDGVYNSQTGEISFNTKKLSSYSVIAKNLPKSTSTASGEPQGSMFTVGTMMNITDMKTYNPNAAITAMQFNKLMAAIASNKKDVALNSALSDEETTSLTRAGIIINGDILTRENAIFSCIKLYEVKTKSSIKDYGMISQSLYSDIGTSDTKYQTSILKASEIGFFGDDMLIRPKDTLTMQDAFDMADIIIQDSGI